MYDDVCIYMYVISICMSLKYPKITWVRDFRFSSSAEHRMGLNSDDLPSIDAWRGSVTDALLIPLEISWSLEQSKICEILGGEILTHGPTVAVVVFVSNLNLALQVHRRPGCGTLGPGDAVQ